MSNNAQKSKAEDVASFVSRGILQAVDEQAEFIHIELEQHYLLIRFR